jgi:crotonobetainyl-CoA:carnitine CoA-transferase CaiB-like acyl-CoA transferase
MTGGPLQGTLVIECAGYLSAPTACYMLGDLGAEVIKIEDREKGDPSRGTSAVFGSSMTLAKAEFGRVAAAPLDSNMIADFGFRIAD